MKRDSKLVGIARVIERAGAPRPPLRVRWQQGGADPIPLQERMRHGNSDA